MDRSVSDFNVRLRTIRIRDLIVGIIIALILSAIVMIIFPEFESDDSTMLIFLVILLILFLVSVKGTKGFKKNIDNLLEDSNKKEILYVCILNIAFTYLIICLIALIDILIGLNDPTWISMFDIDTVDVTSDIIIFEIITSLIFAPVIEEVIFRGILFNRMKIRIGILPAIILSSILFAIGHEFGGITGAFIFGVCMCMLYLKTDNILIPMIVHFLNNLIATITYFLGIDIIFLKLPWIIPFLIVTLIGSLFLIKYMIKEYKKIKKEYV